MAFYEKDSDPFIIPLIIYFIFVAGTSSVEALPAELNLLFVMVRAATYFDHQPNS